jgi:malate dehydrogenase (oxaloacetate-decarboxylating)(NADP+)
MTTLKQQALDYHRFPRPGKISTQITKPAETAHDLSLAYSPGVAEPVRAIAADPQQVYRYTNKGNLVAVISNGSAILGLGNLGAMASKPVMEGKALLFKRFADVDAIDIQVNQHAVSDFVKTVASIADTFGGINLEDIKAPECFEIERQLIKQCNVPVFHDDQHGTAIVTVAAIKNALELQQKKLADAKVVCLGAGAAAIACMDLLIESGARADHIYMLDRQGVIHSNRHDLNVYKQPFARHTDRRTLKEALTGADVFLGLSGSNLLSAEAVAVMAPNPVVFACSNPDPEIDPALLKQVRPDAIFGTGRSDYPNQINNVLCFPFLFRGALDVRASCINTAMKLAAVDALANLAKEPVPDAVRLAYPDTEVLEFGEAYVLPKPVDPRLLPKISKAVAEAAIQTGVATLVTTTA